MITDVGREGRWDFFGAGGHYRKSQGTCLPALTWLEVKSSWKSLTVYWKAIVKYGRPKGASKTPRCCGVTVTCRRGRVQWPPSPWRQRSFTTVCVLHYSLGGGAREALGKKSVLLLLWSTPPALVKASHPLLPCFLLPTHLTDLAYGLSVILMTLAPAWISLSLNSLMCGIGPHLFFLLHSLWNKHTKCPILEHKGEHVVLTRGCFHSNCLSGRWEVGPSAAEFHPEWVHPDAPRTMVWLWAPVSIHFHPQYFLWPQDKFYVHSLYPTTLGPSMVHGPYFSLLPQTWISQFRPWRRSPQLSLFEVIFWSQTHFFTSSSVLLIDIDSSISKADSISGWIMASETILLNEVLGQP